MSGDGAGAFVLRLSNELCTEGLIGFTLGFGDSGGGGAFRNGKVFSAKLDDFVTLHFESWSNLFEVERDRTSICLHVFTALELRDSLDFLRVGMELLSLELRLEFWPLDLLSSDEELRSLMTSLMNDLTLASPFCLGDTVGLGAVLSKVFDFGVSCLSGVRVFVALDSATAFRVFASASATTDWLGLGGTGGGPFSLAGFIGCAFVCTISMLELSLVL